MGLEICRNGKTTHQACAEIIPNSVCSSGPPRVCSLIMVGDTGSLGGDSGGPVFRGERAHGIWQGKARQQGNWVGLYAKADTIHSALPVYLYIQND